MSTSSSDNSTLLNNNLTSDWVEIVDPQSNNIIFVNPETGECTWEKPEGVQLKNPDGEWWELFDQKHSLPYYYNTDTRQTVWVRPKVGLIIPLAKIQSSTLGPKALTLDDKQADDHVSDGKNSDTSKRKSSVRSSKSKSSSISKGIPTESSLSPQKEEPTALTITTEEPRPESMFSPTSNNEMAETKAETSTQNRASSYVSSSKSSPVETAKKSGISSPTINEDAAIQMSPMTASTNLKPPTPAVDSPKSLPSDLMSEINQFQINGFAQKFFSTHKKGLFRKKVPLETLLVWSSESLYQPLLVLNKNLHKDALKCFKSIQKIMGDRPQSKGLTASAELQWIVERGIFNSEIRDEIYVQVVKQLTDNPSPASIKLGWQILASIVICFPPSKNFQNYFKNFIRLSQRNGDSDVCVIATYCQSKLMRICKSGPRGKVPSLPDLEQAMEAPFNPSVFGENLTVIMERQSSSDPNLKLPKVLPFLTDAILQLRGDQSEGIFRVPGDMEQVADLRLRIDKNNYTLESITDCNVPGSLLKFWLRDLEEPLIPGEFYTRCVKEAKEIQSATNIIDSLPEYNRRVAKFVIQFLQIFAREESSKKTKMSAQNLAMVFAPSFLRCPSDDLTEVFTNSKLEQEFLGILISEYHTTPQER
ncbi:hypothetical protein DSO57_1020145 [Entomophthora muscae]|uniref:Uncharacterized protein n=1 Tax=Entomophthora muscae TaxID=34485 RepID=A0ACC2UPZ2_9FUNG|nr:hypothetical protein DSO57_1020145 [Entomophthora muscae]